jgi:protein-S-isoprenylcysteine O-methyltransferase Ste14
MSQTAGVVAPPPLIYLSGLALGLLVDWLASFPSLPLNGPIAWVSGAILVSAGALLIAAALGRFRERGTPPEPWKPTAALETSGIYTRTRNPMYLGMALILLGAGLAFRSPGILLLFPVVILVVDRLVIAREERYLAGLFRAEFEIYRKRVRRWF